MEVVVEVDVELGNFRLFLRLVGGWFAGVENEINANSAFNLELKLKLGLAIMKEPEKIPNNMKRIT